jgi:hypothetical protein
MGIRENSHTCAVCRPMAESSPTPASDQVTNVARAYLKYVETRTPELAWAWDAVDAESWDDPTAKWHLISVLLSLAGSAEQLSAIGAGPLEDLLAMH